MTESYTYRANLGHDGTEHISEDLLRDLGFKWHYVERSPRHWVLWIGQAIPHRYGMSPDDFGVELGRSFVPDNSPWSLWFRADYAGRYSRFLFCRDVTHLGDLALIVEAIIGRPWRRHDILYGQLWEPEQANRLRAEDDRLDLRIARDIEKREDAKGGETA